ncbi:MAG: radical SAM protein [Candidatus Heimdallarchaeota archaeon]|nr:radical SAM protein [Candidatus Heimdallarchaeota archaeon]MCK5143250.1 radical SAM protein [Candidatus Heimdallarchaeota archaeon]
MFIPPRRHHHQQTCTICNQQQIISSSLGVCKSCLAKYESESQHFIKQAHLHAREKFSLPLYPPKGDSFSCDLCNHKCSFSDNDLSFCGLRYSKNGKLVSLSTQNSATLDYYFDPLPCNCCAAWFCPAGTGNGYPEYAYKSEKEAGYYNLSIFFYGCSFDCLFCQNKNHKNVKMGTRVSSEELVSAFKNNPKVSCVCFFGGSPEPQFIFALELSRRIVEIAKSEKRITRICWEWNGFGNQKYIEQAAQLSLQSGGNIKFDLKAWTPHVHKALTGVDNKKVLENFEFVAKNFFEERSNLPVLNATTLLVPGYIDEYEVDKIASFISRLSPDIPYSLLGFYPHFEFSDLPLTSLEHAEKCYEVASEHLNNVNIGNKHLLRK